MSHQIYSINGSRTNLALVKDMFVINGQYPLERTDDGRVVDRFGGNYQFLMNLPFEHRGSYNETLERVEQMLRTEGTT